MTETFDYIVIGAGSAGCVLANRLTEDRSARVLLLEAGGEDDAEELHIPAAYPSLFKTRFDWNYETVEQKHLGGRPAFWPRAKMLGGCSSMNAMVYIRGNKADYDRWRDSYGATGWGYDDVLPYFKKSERNTRLGGPLHGTDGPLHVEDRRYTHPLTEAWVEAAVSWGLKPNDDFNGADQEGAGQYQVTCHRGRRWSTADAFLRPALKRSNLTVRTNALVERVLFDGTRAIGVDYERYGERYTVHASTEVVLSGGAINSPQLLLLSGVGPAAHLREHDIDVVVDLPGVGENLHDHVAIVMVWRTKGTTDIPGLATPAQLARWKLTGRGPFASNIAEAGAFFPTRDGLAAPDMQIHCAAAFFYDNGLHDPVGTGFTAAPTLVDIASRGRLRLRSANPRWRPELDPAYYEEPVDLDAILSATHTVLEIARHSPLARYLDKPFLPNRDGLTDAELIDHIRKLSQTVYHPVGTCAMGTGEQAVVDPELRVRGVEGLRVVDASVMPAIPRGNTNAPTIMVAEKAADLIRA